MDEAAERGTHIHGCLERFLNTGHTGNQGAYSDWISKLVSYPYWERVTPIAVELELCDRRHWIAGKLDVLVIHKTSKKIILVDLKTKNAKQDESGKIKFSKNDKRKLKVQFGGYIDLLYMNYPDLWIDECLVVYAHQFGVETEAFTATEEYRYMYQSARSNYLNQQSKIYPF